jgi:Tfp pilus assembly protein PilP
MKLTRCLMIATLASGTLWAQAPAKTPAATPVKSPTAIAAKAPATTVAKPAAASAKPMAATAAKPAPAMASAKAPAPPKKPAVAEMLKPVPMAKKKQPVPKTMKAAAPVMVAKPASDKEEMASREYLPAGKRDPFVSPIVRATTGGPVCETGKRCLMVDQIQLKGIVKSPSGYIAVVENPLKRAYFLRENDPVFNGSVIKITGDTVVFRETTTDKLGKQGTREVVKKVNAPVV